MMDPTEIIQVLEAQQHVTASLLARAREKSLVICKNQVAELDRLVLAEQALAEQSAQLEDRRLQLAKGVASAFLMAPEQMSLENWPGLTKVQRQRLFVTGQQIRDTVQELKIVNQANRQLLENQLSTTRAVLDHLTRSTPASAYEANGSRAARGSQTVNLFNEYL